MKKAFTFVLLLCCHIIMAQTIVSRIEAESASLGGNAKVNNNHTGFSGRGFVDQMSSNGSKVKFRVNVPSQGNYFVSLHYANGRSDKQSLSIYVNNKFAVNSKMPSTRDWSSWTNKSHVLKLKKGKNTITYQNDPRDSGVVNIDYLWVTKDLGNGCVNQPIKNKKDKLVVTKYAKFPKSELPDGRKIIPRLNTFAYFKDRKFVGAEKLGLIYEIVKKNGQFTPIYVFTHLGVWVNE